MTPDQERQAGALMASAQQGDRRAYEELLTLLAREARGFVGRRVGWADWAEDVVQEVLLTVHRARATYDRSLSVLREADAAGVPAKSGLMVGLGETREELREAFQDLKSAGVRFLTVGQYLPPSPGHHPVEKFYSPSEFEEIEKEAEASFEKAMVGPLVRSSYHADEMVKTESTAITAETRAWASEKTGAAAGKSSL